MLLLAELRQSRGSQEPCDGCLRISGLRKFKKDPLDSLDGEVSLGVAGTYIMGQDHGTPDNDIL